MKKLHNLWSNKISRNICLFFSAFMTVVYLMPISVKSIFVTGMLIVGMAFIVMINGKECQINRRQVSVVGVMHLMWLLLFYIRWSTSGKMTGIAEWIRVPEIALILLFGLVLAVFSTPFFLFLFSFFKETFDKNKEKCLDVKSDSLVLKKRIIGMCFLSAVGIITVCSKSSPLYPFNDWGDANCFFTVGKSMMNGLVVYRDLLEQKGPFLYFIHGIAWLISNDTFFGVYLIEIAAAFGFLYFSYKTVKLLWEDASVIVIPIMTFVVYASTAFCHGDSAEELCLPFVAYAIWVCVKSLKQGKEITAVEYFIIGVTSGCVFWTKFTLVGFYIGWFLLPAFLLIKEKKWNQLGKTIITIAAGVVVATIPYVIYFGMNGAIGDWLKVYIWDNIFLYSSNTRATFAGGLLYNLIYGLECVLTYNTISFYLCIAGIALALDKKYRSIVIQLILMMVCTHFFVYMGGVFFLYYSFFTCAFVPFGMAVMCRVFSYYIGKRWTFMVKRGIYFASVVICLLAAAVFSSNRYMIGMDKGELPHYQFKQIIEKEENPTLLNYGFLDGGFYTVCDIIPNCKAFCRLNIPIEEMYELQDRYVEEGLCDFVITKDQVLETEKYQCVAESGWYFEKSYLKYRLYKLK